MRTDFERTAMPCVPSLARAARRFSPGGDPDDLVQETLLKAFRTYGNFKQGTNCKAWLFSILRSVVLNQKRSHVRKPPMESIGGPDEKEAVMPLASNEGRGEDRRRDEVREAFSRLDADLRWILLLVDVEEFSYAEVGRILDCPVGTVSSRVYRARQSLQDQLQSLGGPQPQVHPR